MIETESIFVNVGLEIIGADGMIDTNNTTFNQRPEALNIVCVNFAPDVYLCDVVDLMTPTVKG